MNSKRTAKRGRQPLTEIEREQTLQMVWLVILHVSSQGQAKMDLAALRRLHRLLDNLHRGKSPAQLKREQAEPYDYLHNDMP